MKRSARTVSALAVCAVSFGAIACKAKSDSPAAPVADSGVPSDPATVKRGEYLVTAVAGCGECHTPRLPDGSLDMTRWLGGVENRFDLEPDDPERGSISTQNLTRGSAGLASWSDDEIRSAIVDGIDDEGKPLSPLMPYYVFHNMDPKDVDAMIAYLRTVPAIDTVVPPRQTLSAPVTAPARPVPDSAIPHTTLAKDDPLFARAEHGRYLAGQVGLCMDCHTPWRVDADQPLPLDRLFSGGRGFSKRDWTVTDPKAPPIVYSHNLTPDDSGLAGWTAENIASTLRTGRGQRGTLLCRPMPGGPNGAHGGLTDEDALDIGYYISTLPPIVADRAPACPLEDEPAAGDAGSD